MNKIIPAPTPHSGSAKIMDCNNENKSATKKQTMLAGLLGGWLADQLAGSLPVLLLPALHRARVGLKALAYLHRLYRLPICIGLASVSMCVWARGASIASVNFAIGSNLSYYLTITIAATKLSFGASRSA